MLHLGKRIILLLVSFWNAGHVLRTFLQYVELKFQITLKLLCPERRLMVPIQFISLRFNQVLRTPAGPK